MALLLLLRLVFAMLLPSGTDVPGGHRPRIVFGIIAACGVVHLLVMVVQLGMDPLSVWVEDGPSSRQDMETAMGWIGANLGLVPRSIFEGSLRGLPGLVTAHFLHADIFHLLFNVWTFYVFAANVEDLFGRRQFVALVAGAVLLTDVAVLVAAAADPAAAAIPHMGMSGMVYAAAGAYLVCFPRSHVKVLLIYNPAFWVMLFLMGGAMSMIAVFFLPGSLWQLVWLGVFVILFVGMQPGHTVFGLPVLVFLGLRIGLDVATFMSTDLVPATSFWGHAGGFAAGVAGGLMVNGTRGFGQRYSVEDDPDANLSSRQRLQRQEERLKAEGSPGALRELLGRRVFTGDADGATQLYVEDIHPRHPGLFLDADLQLVLARMLATRGYEKQSLHAYDLLLSQPACKPAEMSAAFLEAAAICARLPEHLEHGIDILARLSGVEIPNRDREEARRIRAEITAEAGRRGMTLREAQPPPASPEPAPPPAAPARETATRTTTRMASLKPAAATPPEGTGTVADGRAGQPAEHRGAGTDAPAPPQHALPPGPPAVGRRAAEPPAGSRGPEPPPVLQAMPARRSREPGTYAPMAQGDAERTTYAVLIAPESRGHTAALMGFFRGRLRDEARARRALDAAHGVAATRLGADEVGVVMEDLACRGLRGVPCEEPPSARGNPVICDGFAVTGEGVVWQAGVANGTAEFADVALLAAGRVRLSPQSKSSRLVADLWMADGRTRIHVPLDVIAPERLAVDGAAAGEAGAPAVLAALFARVPADRQTGSPVVEAADAGGGVASFDTVLAYENHMLAALLGERQET